jgi:hypothetical protein
MDEKEVLIQLEARRDAAYTRLANLITEYMKDHRPLSEIPEDVITEYEYTFHAFFKSE